MNETNSILVDTRKALGLTETDTSFDTELLQHINSAIGKLYQNGIGKLIIVTGEEQKWVDLKDPLQTQGNEYFGIVPLYITLSTKLLFDPPPPSNVEYHSNNAKELLWRLKISYEPPLPEGGDEE